MLLIFVVFFLIDLDIYIDASAGLPNSPDSLSNYHQSIFESHAGFSDALDFHSFSALLKVLNTVDE